jgi:hypothetical protein
VAPFYDTDFLSMWSISDTGTLSDWSFIRDVSKVLTTKLMYTGMNENIIKVPLYHRLAILQSLRCGEYSRLMEKAMFLMALNCECPEDMSRYQDVLTQLDLWNYRDRSPMGYVHEDEINARCNFDIGDLYLLAVTNEVYLGSRPESKTSQTPAIALNLEFSWRDVKVGDSVVRMTE